MSGSGIKCRSLGLQPSPCVLGTALGLQLCALGKKPKHREVGREGMLKAEGISKYSWCINLRCVWLVIWGFVSVPLPRGERIPDSGGAVLIDIVGKSPAIAGSLNKALLKAGRIRMWCFREPRSPVCQSGWLNQDSLLTVGVALRFFPGATFFEAHHKHVAV